MVRTLITILCFAVMLTACGGAETTSPAAEKLTLSAQEAQGQQLVSQYCAACHSTVGEAVIVGPPMAGVATRAETRVAGQSAHDYIVESILDPGIYLVPGFDDLMPSTWGKTLTGEELDALVAFLLTLH